MKRNEIVGKLLKEGFSEKTLVRFSDKQLNELADRILSEQPTTSTGAPVSINPNNPQATAIAANLSKQNIKTSIGEELKGNQKKIDKNHNGKIDGQDFKILKGQKKKHDVTEMLRFFDDDGETIKDEKGKETAVSTKDKDYEKKVKGKDKEEPKKKEEVKEGLFGGNHKKVDTIKHDGHEIDVFSKGNEKVYAHPRKEGTKGQNDSERLVYSDLEGLKKSASSMNKGEKNINFPKSKKIDNPDYKSTVVDINEVDMGLTIKGSKSSGLDVFGGKSKSSTPSAPKKKTNPFEKKEKKEKEETGENDDTDESIDSILHKAIAEKLEKVLDREPTEEEIDEVLEKYMEQYQEHNESDESEEEENESEKPSEGLSKEKKGEDISKKEKSDKYSEEEIEKDKKRWPKNPFKPEKRPSPNFNGYKKKEDVKETKNWVNNLVENEKFHSFTSKNEIMELIKTKLTESDTMTQVGPKVKRGHNGVPEFMTYDAITTAAEPTTKPKPTTKPGTKPGEKPKTPYQPGPGPNPKPKAMYEEKKSK